MRHPLLLETTVPSQGGPPSAEWVHVASYRVDWRGSFSSQVIIPSDPVDPIRIAFKPVYFWDTARQKSENGIKAPKSSFREIGRGVADLSAAFCAFGTAGMFPTSRTTGWGLFRKRPAHRFESFTSDAVFGS